MSDYNEFIQEAYLAFEEANKLARKEHARALSKGLSGYLPCFEDKFIKAGDIVSEMNLGIIDISLRKIIGTKSRIRSLSFAPDFMPLLKRNTEFAQKWITLCASHLTSGIRDPVTAIEYLNYFYIIEGNKRISVLKYFNAHSFSGYITRFIPKYNSDNREIRLYYEFLDFYKNAKINSIWLSNEGSFSRLWENIRDYWPSDYIGVNIEDRFKHFDSTIYQPFRRVFHEMAGGKLPTTTGDVFLHYIEIYGLPLSVFEDNIKVRLKVFIDEFNMKDDLKPILSLAPWTNPDIADKKSVKENKTPIIRTVSDPFSSAPAFMGPFQTPSIFLESQKTSKLKVAFVYPGMTNQPGWSHSHDLGRQKVQKDLESSIDTTAFENIQESPEAYGFFADIARKGFDIVFATSPAYIKSALKAALEFPSVRFFNCSEFPAFKHLHTYSGRIYEARFLTGIIAGTLTSTDILGYIATYPLPGIISSINAFALGARLVNHKVKVKVGWIDFQEEDSIQNNAEINKVKINKAKINKVDMSISSRHENKNDLDILSAKLASEGADIISFHNTFNTDDIGLSPHFGTCSMLCDTTKDFCSSERFIAAPVWNWGVFYSRILHSILSDIPRFFLNMPGMVKTDKLPSDLLSQGKRPVSFYWGLDSGIVDLFYSFDIVPSETQKLLNLMKKMIAGGVYNPFTGPIYDIQGNLRLAFEETASYESIMNMSWFVDAIDTKISEGKKPHELFDFYGSTPSDFLEIP